MIDMIPSGKFFINYYTWKLCLSYTFYNLSFNPDYNVFYLILFPWEYHELGFINIEW